MSNGTIQYGDYNATIGFLRGHPEWGQFYQEHSDYEVYTDMRKRFDGYKNEFPQTPPLELWQDHVASMPPGSDLDKYGVDFNLSGTMAELEKQGGDLEPYDYDNQGARTKSMFGQIMGVGPVVDWMTPWIRDAIKQGANESITGLATHIVSGEAPFILEHEYPEEEDMFQSALAFGVSMLYDSWFFLLGPGGWGAFSLKFAGATAQKAAAQQISKHFFAKKIANQVGKGTLGKLTASDVATVMAGRGVKESSEHLIHYAGKGSKELIESLSDDAVRESAEYLSTRIASGDLMKGFTKGIKIGGETVVEGQKLKTLFNAGGIQTAAALGSYNIVQDVEAQIVNGIQSQINPETGEPYGEKADWFFKRWGEGRYAFSGDIEYNIHQTIMAGLQGVAGGYFAGGLNMVLKAGRWGAFRGDKGWKKYMANHSRLEKIIYNQFVGLGVEATGFAGIGALLEKADSAITGQEYDDTPFSKRWLHTLVTLGTLKGLHSFTNNFKKGWKSLEGKMLDGLEKKKISMKDVTDKATQNLNSQKKAEDDLKRGLKDQQKKYETMTDKDGEQLKGFGKRIIEAIDRIFDKDGNPSKDKDGNFTGRREELEALEENLKNIIDFKNKFGDMPELQAILDKHPVMEALLSDVLTPEGKRGKLMQKLSDEIEIAENKKKDDLEPNVINKDDELWVPSGHPDADLNRPAMWGASGNDPVLYHRKKGTEAPRRTEEKKADETAETIKITKDMETSEDRTPSKKIEDSSKIYDEHEGKLEEQRGITSTIARSIRRTIKKFEGTNLGKVMKAIVGDAIETGKGKATLRQKLTLANQFYRWWQKNKEGSFLDAKRNDMEVFLEEKYKNPRGQGAPQSNAKYVLGAITGKHPALIKLFHRKTDAKVVPLTAKERQQSQIRLNKAVTDEKGEVVGDRNIQITPKISITANVALAVDYIIGRLGGRKDRIFGGASNNHPLRRSDLKLTEIHGMKAYIIKYTSKGDTSIQIPVFDLAIGENGYNYFKVFDALAKQHKALGKGENEPLLLNTKGTTMSKQTYDKFVKKFILMDKKGATGHTTRHTALGIAKLMDSANIPMSDKVSKLTGGSWRQLVDSIMLTHEGETAIQKVYSEWAEATDKAGLHNKVVMIEEFWNKSKKVIKKDLSPKEQRELDKQARQELLPEEKKVPIEPKKKEPKKKVKANLEGNREEQMAFHQERIESIERDLKKATSAGEIENLKSQLMAERMNLSSLKKYGKKQHVGLRDKSESLAREELREQRIEELKKNPGLKIAIDKDKKWAGEIVDGIIRLVEGKADITTFFHENVHRLEAFIRKSGDQKMIKLWDRGERITQKWAEKNDSKRWDKFVEKYGKNAANEYLTQLSAEWSVTRANAKGLGGRLSMWFKQITSKIKTMMGLGTAKDVARIFGKISEKGFSTEGMKLSVMKKQWGKDPIYESTSPIKQEQKDKIKNLRRQKFLEMDDFEVFVLSQITDAKGESLLQKGYDSFANLQEGDAHRVIDFIDINMRTNAGKRGKAWSRLNIMAHTLQNSKGITTDMGKELKLGLGIHKGSLRYATEKQLLMFIDIAREYGRDWDGQTALVNEQTARQMASIDPFYRKIQKFLGRYTLPVDIVLRKFGGKPGERIADKLLDHYLTETHLAGKAGVAISDAEKLIGRKNLKYLPFLLDPALQEANVHGDKIKMPKGFEGFKQDSLVEGSREAKAVKVMKNMYDFYWNALMTQGRANISNPRAFEKWSEKMQKKYVGDYFTRVITPKAKQYFALGSKGFDEAKEYMFNDLVKIWTRDTVGRIRTLERRKISVTLRNDLTEGEISRKRAEYDKRIKVEEKRLKEIEEEAYAGDSELHKKISMEVDALIVSKLNRKRNKVTNKFLLSRQPRLPNIIRTSERGDIQVYETNFEKVVGQYTRVMSNFLATAKHMPEFTDVREKFGTSAQVAGDWLEAMSKNSDVGAYAAKVLKRRIGLEPIDLDGAQTRDVFTQIGRWSAVMGLSSPMSGLKNLAIGTSMGLGVFGRQYLKGIAKVFSSDARRKMRSIGVEQIGTKELEITGLPAMIMRKISWMTPTESANRVASGYAALFTAEPLVDSLRGNRYSLFSKNTQSRKAAEKLQRLFRLTKEEVAFLKNYGLDGESHGLKSEMSKRVEIKQQEIKDKIAHYGHIITQGATGDPFLPLWAGEGKAKSLTLFYRMAYAGTHNVFAHIMKPAAKGNLLPLARHVIAGHVFGGALWSLYEHLLGSPPPKMNEDALAQLGQNLAKTESLALFSFLLNPYQAPGMGLENILMADSIMQPAFIRNIKIGLELALSAVTGAEKKNIPDEFGKALESTFVLVGHLEKGVTKAIGKSGFKRGIKEMYRYKDAWMKKSGHWEDENKNNKFNDFTSPNAVYNRLIKEAFLNEDLESAARYYAATWFYMFDNYRNITGRMQMFDKEAVSLVDRALKGVLDQINPFHLGEDETWKMFDKPPRYKPGRAYSKKEAFFKYLTPENAKKAEKLEKRYWYLRRKLTDYTDKEFKKFLGHADKGRVMDLFGYGFKPSIYLFGQEMNNDIKFKNPGSNWGKK